jgi:hypothetical protein
VGINGTSAADALTLSKAAGGAAYTLALPAAAPAANTYLNYTGSSYVWGAASGGSGSSALVPFTGATSGSAGTAGGVPAPPSGQQTYYLQANGTWSPVVGTGIVAAQYYYASATSNPVANTNITFNTNVVNPGGGAISTINGSSFTLQPGYAYKIFALMNYNGNGDGNIAVLQLYANSFTFGTVGMSYGAATTRIQCAAFGYLNPTITTTLTVQTAQPTMLLPGYINIEVVGNNNAITAFAGATSTTDGIVGYIPAPPAGTQNSYLRGDGKWIQANNAPTAAAYMHVTNVQFQAVDKQPFEFATTVTSAGNSITHPNSTSFILQAGNTYKCTASIGACTTWTTGIGPFGFWSTSTTGTAGYFGNRGAMDTSYYGWQAVGYISPTINTTIYFMISNLNLNVPPAYMNPGDSWATIEVVSNNNTITAFTGATSTTNGVVGYIPTPLSGQQNSYLRGDGTWQQANNAPTAAQYYMAGQPTSTSINLNANFRFSMTPIMSAGSAITQISETQFRLSAGYTYKLTTALNRTYGGAYEVIYQWYNTTSSPVPIGCAGNSSCVGVNQNTTAIAYLVADATITVAVQIIFNNGNVAGYTGISIAGLDVGRQSFAMIEVVSNNNAITAFTGATSAQDGTLGYLPAPKAGQQNSYLCGNGTWQSATVGPFAAQYLHVFRDISADVAAGTPVTFPRIIANVGTAIGFSAPFSAFVLAPGYSYKLMCYNNFSGTTTSGPYQWYNSTTATLIGITGNLQSSGDFCQGPAIAYISPTVSTSVSIYGCNSTGLVKGIATRCDTIASSGVGQYYFLGFSVTIEVVSNNNNITAFSGATATNDGIVGYIPAPKAGNQNMFLRGDGQWQNATIANYYMAYATAVARNGAITFGIVPVNIGTAIATTDNKAYTLAAGYTYKITVMLTVNSYSDYNSVKLMNNGVQFGTTTYGNSSGTTGVFQYTNVGYILATTSASTFTTNYYSQSGTAETPLGFFSGITACSCLIIEVVSGNNAITAFTGCDATKDGIVGYIPPPKAGSQNMFLRGDGQWQNATAANYLFATSNANQTITAPLPYIISFPDVISNNGVTKLSPTQFVLPAGATYKLSANITYNNGNMVYRWFNITSGNYIGEGANNSGGTIGVTNFACITTTVATTVSLYVSYGIGVVIYGHNSSSDCMGPWISIEVISGNNAITAFKGATTNTDGGVGYIPAPLAGTQNSYLRGDGTWQQANNAPTAAIYLHMNYIATDNTIIPTINSQQFPFNNTVDSTGTFGVITLVGSPTLVDSPTTSFELAPGYIYKCTAAMGYVLPTNNEFVFQWRDVTNSLYFGSVGVLHSNLPRSNLAFGYIKNMGANTIRIALLVTYTPSSNIVSVGTLKTYPWCSIEVVSNNNTITAFTGATLTTNGVVGYIPAPPAGTQNSYLRGDGTWQQANNAPTAAQYLHAANTINNVSYGIDVAIPFASLLVSVGSAIGYSAPYSAFVLNVGYTYKLTGCVSYQAGAGIYQWYDLTTPGYIGTGGYGTNPSLIAISYITPTVTTSVSLRPRQVISLLNQSGISFCAWITIEVVSNNNTITQFAGCTAYQNGSIGYIPAPQAGQHNHVLTGAGSWAPYRSTLGPFTVSGSSLLISGIPPSKKITITYDLLGITNTNNVPIIQLGTSSGIVENTYNSNQNYIGPTAGSSNETNGFWIGPASAATEARTGQMILTNVNNTIWVSTGQCAGPARYTHFNNGRVNLSGVLDRIQITSNGGTFNTTNSINVLCEM